MRRKKQDNTLINNLITKYQKDKDENAFTELYKMHELLIKNVSASYAYMTNLNYESEMNFAFYNAVRTFNPEKKACFNTYFKTCVDNQIKATLTYQNAYKRSIDRHYVSLDSLCNLDGQDDITVLEQMQDTTVTYEQDCLTQDVYETAKEILTEQEKQLLDLIYQGYTYKEISQMFNVTPACIRVRFLNIKHNIAFLKQIKKVRSNYMEETFLIIDGHSIGCRAAFAATPMINSKGMDTGTIYRFLKSIISMIKKINPTHIVVCWDVSRNTWRSKLYPQYKANRGEAHETNYIAFNEIKQILEAVGIRNIEVDKYEGDDLVGTFANLSTADKTFIMSGDKDLFQCVNDSTKVLFPTKDGYITVDNEYLLDNYGVDSKDYIQLKALMGDDGDNIPGIKGVSVKTAGVILNTYKDIKNLKDVKKLNIKRVDEQDFKQWQKQMNTILKLVTINTKVPVKIDMEDCEFKADWYKALPMFRKLEFNSLITKIQDLPKGVTR